MILLTRSSDRPANGPAAIALFGVGVAGAIVFGSVLAAYDLWGGVPRSMWLLMRAIATVSTVAMVAGSIGAGGSAGILLAQAAATGA